jgi:hypothetical protein
MTDRLFQGYSTFSNHGTSQGIIPRFYLQMVDMAQFAFDKKSVEEKLQNFLYNNISDLTDFYDVFTELKSIYLDYREGLKSGKYYSLDDKGSFRHNRRSELVLKKKVKDFFIQGRLMIYNFGKSGVIDDKEFILNNFLIVNDKNFEKNKRNCLNSSVGKKYEILLRIIEKARKDFLTSFNQIRADFDIKTCKLTILKLA